MHWSRPRPRPWSQPRHPALGLGSAHVCEAAHVLRVLATFTSFPTPRADRAHESG